jgi:hypothetical protein
MILAPPFLNGTEVMNFSLPSPTFLAMMTSVLIRYSVAYTICTSLEITATGSSRTNYTPGSDIACGRRSFFSI